MATPEHKQLANWILQQVHSIAKDYNNNPNMQRLYHAGFLASYLANLLKNDYTLRKQFERHIQQTKRNNQQ